MTAGLRWSIRWGVCGLGLLTVSGCFSFDAKQFEVAINGGQLRVEAALPPTAMIPAPVAAAPAAAQGPEATTADTTMLSVSASDKADADGTEAASVSTAAEAGAPAADRIIVTASGRSTRRVPDYGPDETASLICVMQKIGFDDANARRAHQATLAARDIREAFEKGRVTAAEAEEAERRRQDAVQSALSPVPFVDLIFSPVVRRKDLPAPTYKSVSLEQGGLSTLRENGRDTAIVYGLARNTGRTAVELPPVTLEALDGWEFVLSGQSSLLPFTSLAPGETKAFEMRMLDPPENTAEVYVHFAPPFRYRWRRDCDFFGAGLSASEEGLKAIAASEGRSLWGILDETLDAYKPATAPATSDVSDPSAYSAAELNTLTRFFRREAAWAWECSQSDRRECAGAADRLHWRDVFAIAEATDEAWVAVDALEGMRRRASSSPVTDADMAAAERAGQDAARMLASLGAAALRRAGTSVDDVVVELTTSFLKLDGTGLYLDIAGRITNAGASDRQVDALLVALVDRFGLPLSSVTVAAGAHLTPGQVQDFAQRIPMTRIGSRPALSRQTAGVLGRVPPEEIPWEVRVGAMGRATASAP